MTNIEAARKALLVWYECSGMNFHGMNFEQAVDFLANKAEPARLHLNIFGDAVQALPWAKVEDAMITLGEANPGKIPYPQYFFDTMRDAVDPYAITNFLPIVGESVVAGLKDTAGLVKDYGGFGLKSLYWLALAGVGLYIFTNAGGAKLIASARAK